MDLGPALSAAQGYFQAQDQRALRDRERQRYEWERQRAESEMSLLGDKVAATRAQYRGQLSDAAARDQVRPGETANTVRRQQQEGIGLDRAGMRQGMVEDTKDQQARIDRDTSLINQRLTEIKAEDLPRAIALQRQQGIINEADMRQASMVALARLADEGNNNAIVKYLNDMNDVSPDQNSRFAAPVARVGVSRENPDMLVAMDAQGNPIRQFSVSKLRQMAYPSQIVKLGDGDRLYRTDGLGNIAQLANNPKTFDANSGAGGQDPADIRAAQALLNQGVAPDFATAWDMVRQSREPSKAAFIQNYVSENAGVSGKSTDVLVSEASAAYDQSRRAGRPGMPSNSGAPFKINPQLGPLLGIPSQ